MSDSLLSGPRPDVKVKPLVWAAGDGKSRSKDCFTAKDGFGGFYTVVEAQWSHSQMGVYLTEATDEAAKAAAQADCEARILSALEPAAPSPDVLDDPMVKALVQLLGMYLSGLSPNNCAGGVYVRDLRAALARITDTGRRKDG